MPAAIPVSIFLIACNEADRLGRTLQAVQGLTDDIVLVDSGSTDDTIEIAASFGARVVHNPWPGYGPQKRFAESLCRHRWVLNIDADEVMPPDLVAELRALFADGEPPCDAFEIAIAEVFPVETAPHPWAYSLAPVRLYRTDRGRYSDSPVHDRVVLAEGARVGRLKGRIHHFSVRSLGEQIAKLNAYTDQQADDLDRRGVKLPVWRLFTEFPAAFLKAYVGRRHFVRGLYGVMTAANYAFFRYLRLAKHLERRMILERRTVRQARDGQ
ncbi:glycosyltransferase family 2 protein [Blastochloris sulfoviridis]|uniref:Glycosyltransferase family 2 protein n=1 Tax=Blastochloris sulfoviridis TaxID=50712 RepID=A0A5M6I380_9HYPH|nr:glycosyltransferase family 2 protein [Blastochloris sulfoviridis]KAA5602317.1 glycosyltransferase family 2 protein [Blastochloris sulfoviridis]